VPSDQLSSIHGLPCDQLDTDCRLPLDFWLFTHKGAHHWAWIFGDAKKGHFGMNVANLPTLDWPLRLKTTNFFNSSPAILQQAAGSRRCNHAHVHHLGIDWFLLVPTALGLLPQLAYLESKARRRGQTSQRRVICQDRQNTAGWSSFVPRISVRFPHKGPARGLLRSPGKGPAVPSRR
jgi:hypothetical protein